MNNILVVGLGYIGLPLALRLAELGHTVYGRDIDSEKRKVIKDRISPWPLEPQIDFKLKHTTLQLWNGEDYDTIIFCTPVNDTNLSDLLPAMQLYNLDDKLVIVESTLPPLGTDKILSMLPKSAKFAYAPERLTAGRLWHNLTQLPRVIGGDSMAAEIYQRVTSGHITLTDLRTAELVKLAENAYRYEKIDFANDLALECQELLGANVWNVVDILNSFGVDLPTPGAGIGGYCLVKDHEFLSVGERWRDTAGLVQSYLQKGDRLILLGEAYKANVSDMRNSPAWDLLAGLPLYDLDSHIIIDQADTIPSCDVLVIVQPHSIYREIDWSAIGARIVIDLCGFFQIYTNLPEDRQWQYVCLGVNQGQYYEP